MYSENSRESIRNLLQEAALHYQRAAEESDESGEAGYYQERAALLEELMGQVEASSAMRGGQPSKPARKPEARS